MNIFRFLVPFTYFFKSRLQAAKDIVFHFYYEWLIAFLLLYYFTDFNLLFSIKFFLAGYLAFISIYEIGYLGNDVYSVRNEENPRLRIKDFNPSNVQLAFWIGFRILIFLSITFWLQVHDQINWWVFYGTIGVFFWLHNVLKQKELKIFTFINLAFTRFLAPVFIALEPGDLSLIAPGILLNYVFYRTLTYMDSKDLLVIPSRKSASFKLNFYLLIAGTTLLNSLLVCHPLPFLLTIYYLLFWGLFFWVERRRVKVRQ